VRAPGVGHGVIGSGTCGTRAVRAFFADAAPPACAPPPDQLRVAPVPPRSLGAVAPLRGVPGRAGRTASAIGLTIEDAATATQLALITGRVNFEEFLFRFRVPGLRAGSIDFALQLPHIKRLADIEGASVAFVLRYDDVEYVPGVRLSGTVADTFSAAQIRALGRGRNVSGTLHGTLRAGGPAAARGRLRVTPRGALVGTLGGRRVIIHPGLLTPERLLEGPTSTTALETALRIDPDCCG
jgi:hypothetical protein